MDIALFFKGMILGFSIAAPVGPIGILCIRRTLQYGKLSGLVSGTGAAVADAIYAIIAAFGLTMISNFLVAGEYWFQLLGGFFMIYLGGKIFFTKLIPNRAEVAHKTLLNDFFSVFILTLTNPMTILSFFAVFAAIGLSSINAPFFDAFLLVLGVFLGSFAWWFILSEGVALFRGKISDEFMLWVNRFAGVTIFLFGLIALLALVTRSS